MDQTKLIHPVAPFKPKTAAKPTVAAKPGHLKKTDSIEKHNDAELPKARPLAKRSSLQHMTPKVWVKIPVIDTESERKVPHLNKRVPPPSPFGSNQWRPAPKLHTKPVGARSAASVPEESELPAPQKLPPKVLPKSLSYNKPSSTAEEPTGVTSSEDTTKPEANETKSDSPQKIGAAKRPVKSTLSGSRSAIQYRPSFRRDDQSPGIGTLIKKWDIKDAPSCKANPSSGKNAIPSPRSPVEGDSWKPMFPPQMNRNEPINSSLDSHNFAATSEFRQRASSIKYQSPTPFVSRMSQKTLEKEGTENQPDHTTQSRQSFDFDEHAINHFADSNESFKDKNKQTVLTHRQLSSSSSEQTPMNTDSLKPSADQYAFANTEVAIYQGSSDNESPEPGRNVATYEDFDENDDEIECAIYEVATDVPVRHNGHIHYPPGYLAMSGNTSPPDVIRYEAMGSESDLAEIDYSDLVVPAPKTGKFSKPEYHEIDPNVPPPPNREPPKLPFGVKPLKPVVDEPPSDPPPLPPDNVVGRRSMILSKKKQRLVVKDLNERVNQGQKKLNYIEVEVSSNMGPSPSKVSPYRKTNYTDVTLLSESDISTRDRSGSGTSDEGLSSSSKNKSKVKKKIQALFTSKDQTTPDKQSDKSTEQLTDFEKERNKKKRISGRFGRKKQAVNNKNKKQQNTNDEKESDSGTYDLESASSATSADTSRSTSVVNTSSSGGSTQSSGDGEVASTQLQGEEPSHRVKVLPTPVQTGQGHRRWSQDAARVPPVARPRVISKSSSQSSIPVHAEEGIYQDSEDVVTPPVAAPKVKSFLHQMSNNSSSSQNGVTDVAPKPLPREPSFVGLGPPPVLPKPSRGDPLTPSGAQGPARPPKSDIVRDKWTSMPSHPPPLPPTLQKDGAPPPLPNRDPVDNTEYLDFDFMPEASNLVPPSPFGFKSSKFLDSEPLYQIEALKESFKRQVLKITGSDKCILQIYRNRTMSHASSRRRAQTTPSPVPLPTPIVPEGKEEAQEDKEWRSELDEMETSTLWRSIPEVKESGIAQEMSKEEIKLQQAQFEVITSQASYLRSLNILVSHFMGNWAMQSSDYLPPADRKHLFSNLPAVRDVETKFLQELEKHFWDKKRLSRICELVAQYAKSDFDVYVRYLQNKTFQDRVLTKLQRTNDRFTEELRKLESSEVCNKLPLLSFLLLPMQRVTRLPLLVSAIVNAADAAGDIPLLKMAKHALGVVNKLVKKCNEAARKMEQTEQLAEIAAQLDYPQSVKMFALVSQSRSLVKKGEMSVSMTTASKKGSRGGKFWIFLFSDVLFVTRKKSFMESGSSPRFEVLDWAKRSMLFVNEHAVSENSIFLVMLENQSRKKVEVTLSPTPQNEMDRWTEALSPPSRGSAGESIYETWDCPQYTCLNPYQAQQPDELSIDVNDVMRVLKKSSEGWVHGERMRDGETGWFPSDHCEEIEDEHVRSRNLKNLYKTFAS